MIRQYVGARYVPKFASPVEWASGTSYEALTIVTFNNASYTSKVPVPPTVGDPANNPQYWALTGNYNAQVEQYRQETETVSNNLTTEITNRKNADTAIQGQISAERDAREEADSVLSEKATSLQTQISEERTERSQQDAVLSARMNEFTKLPSGSLSTAADAELVDIRVKADGTSATTAGNAVRDQISDLKSELNCLDYILVNNYAQYQFGDDKVMYLGAFESGGQIMISSPYPWAKFRIYNLDGTFNSEVGSDNAKERNAVLPNSGSIVYASVYSPSGSAFDVTSVRVRVSNIEKYKSKYTDALSDASGNTVAKTVTDTEGSISYADSSDRVSCSPILQADNVVAVKCSDKYKIMNFYFDESIFSFRYAPWDTIQYTSSHSINVIVVKKADGSTISSSDIAELERNIIFFKEFERGDFQTIYIASKDASHAEKSRADIVCDGTDDVAKINRALKYFEFLGVSGTLKFSQGKFIINDAYKTFSDTDKFLNVFGIKSEYPQRNITFEGTNPPIRKYGETTLQLNNTAVFSMTQSLYDSIQDDGYLMMFTCLQDANTGSIAYPKLSMNIKNIAIEIPNNKKPIILIDGKYASNMSVSNVIGCATLSNYNSGYHPEDIGIEKCIGIRGLDGMNFGEGYRLDNIYMYYMGIGFSLGGEHLIAQNLGTYGCYINYAMGLYGDRPSVHPNTLINCCGEQGVNDWVFGSNPYKQHISIIDYNMERMNNWPMNKAIERDLQNRYCGHITFQSADDTYTNSPNAEFWEEGYGEYFDTTNLTAVFNN